MSRMSRGRFPKRGGRFVDAAQRERQAREDERETMFRPTVARALGIDFVSAVEAAIGHDCGDYDFGGCPCFSRERVA